MHPSIVCVCLEVRVFVLYVCIPFHSNSRNYCSLFKHIFVYRFLGDNTITFKISIVTYWTYTVIY